MIQGSLWDSRPPIKKQQDRIRIGTSGYSFPDWIGTIYPQKLKRRDMLGYYENELGFDTVEINSTYYALPSLKGVENMVAVRETRLRSGAVSARLSS